jgi:hypothetical protein
LLRAFGPPAADFHEAVDGALAFRVTRELGLVERIGARVDSTLLARELGRETARELAVYRLRALAGVQGLLELVPQLASASASASMPVVLLKLAALHATGCLLEGSRAAADIDVLVPERDAERAASILVGLGFHAEPATPANHHLPPFHDRRGRVVELHTRVLGLRDPRSRRFATFDSLVARDAVEPAPGLAPGCHVLRPELMAAHLIVHGIAHHGGSDDYPVMRTLGDVIDVLPDDRAVRGLRAIEWISSDVDRGEVEAALSLCDALERGTVNELLVEEDSRPESLLLRHVLAGALDPGYRSGLVVDKVLRPVTDEPRWRRVLSTLRWAVFPTDAELAARLGVPDARLVDGRLRRAHAGQLARKAPRYALAAARLVWRRLGRARPPAD